MTELQRLRKQVALADVAVQAFGKCGYLSSLSVNAYNEDFGKFRAALYKYELSRIKKLKKPHA